MKNNQLRADSETNSSKQEFNSLSAVEQVYPADIIDSAVCVNDMSSLLQEMPFDTQRESANEAFVDADRDADENGNADIYSLNSARLAKHNRSAERRSGKSRLTDRRSAVRLNADGEIQPDRRAENRAANIESVRLSATSKSDQANSTDTPAEQ